MIVVGLKSEFTSRKATASHRRCPTVLLPLLLTQCMSQQSAASKPSLQGVRIKARKGAVKAQAKHEPTSRYILLSKFTSIMSFQSSEINSTNISKLYQRPILILSQQSSSKQVPLLNSSNMQMPYSRSSLSAVFCSQVAASLTMERRHLRSLYSMRKNLRRWTT